MAGGHDRLHRVPPVGLLEPLLAGGCEEKSHGAPVDHTLAPVSPRPVQDDVTGQHADYTDEESRPRPDQTFVAHHAGGEDRHLFRYGQAQAAREEHEEQAEIGELLDERLEALHGQIEAQWLCQNQRAFGRRGNRGLGP